MGDVDNAQAANGSGEGDDKHISMAAAGVKVQTPNTDSRSSSPPSGDKEPSKENMEVKSFVSSSSQSSPTAALRQEDQNNNNQKGSSPARNTADHAAASPAPAPPAQPKVRDQIMVLRYRHPEYFKMWDSFLVINISTGCTTAQINH